MPDPIVYDKLKSSTVLRAACLIAIGIHSTALLQEFEPLHLLYLAIPLGGLYVSKSKDDTHLKAFAFIAILAGVMRAFFNFGANRFNSFTRSRTNDSKPINNGSPRTSSQGLFSSMAFSGFNISLYEWVIFATSVAMVYLSFRMWKKG